jgi:hypothetical protein
LCDRLAASSQKDVCDPGSTGLGDKLQFLALAQPVLVREVERAVDAILEKAGLPA